ncbi:meiotic spindle pole body KASH domain protein Kms1 [Schizosaccharomyces osmophilus]|uniref:Meiotic spindle pole body KASH domain protein Kms1 n=1 Tax=Schizosaccharomyces osmophilus TaxID=2545709 RepID=A0AAF0AWW5_9SCHI|nr:meiotic spindle pole body KASH domain protein Kms1 [Schizosaccharomyces osmophilus]WBW73475.1 meiotic spindle pole body KASH domain protein Kms1 [Schizosaccharomyces osmophilus]
MQNPQDFDLIFDSYDFGKEGKISLTKLLSVIGDLELLRSTSSPPLLNEFQKRATSEFVQKNADLSITKDNLRQVLFKLIQSSKSENASADKNPVEQFVFPLVQHSQASSSPVQEHAMEDSSFDSIESPSKIQAQKLLLPTNSKKLEMKSPNILSTPFAHSTPITWNPLPSAADRVANQFNSYGMENNSIKSQNLRLKELQDSLDQARDQARNKSRIVDLLNGKIDELAHYLSSLETQHREMNLTQEAQNLQIRKLKSKNESLSAENENFQSELLAKSNEIVQGKKQLSMLESKCAASMEELEKKSMSFNELYKAASESLLNEDTLSNLKFENHKLRSHCQQLEDELEEYRKEKHNHLEENPLRPPSPMMLEKLTVSSFSPFLSMPFSPAKMVSEEKFMISSSDNSQAKQKENPCRNLLDLENALSQERLRNKELTSGFTILSEEIGIQKWIIQSLSNMSPLLHEFKNRYEISMPGIDDPDSTALYSSIQSSREESFEGQNELTSGSPFLSFIDKYPATSSNVAFFEKLKNRLSGFIKFKWRPVLVQILMSLLYTLRDLSYIVIAALCQQIIRFLLSFFEELIQASNNESNLAQPS